MEKFTVQKKEVYTIKTVDGDFEVIGTKGLQDYCDNIMGAFVDRMSANRSGNPIRAKQQDHEFLMNNREDLETIFEMQDHIKSLIAPPAKEIDCNDYYCNRCGSSSGIEFCGD